MDYIFMEERRIGDTNYTYGDKLDIPGVLKRKLMNEGLVEQFKKLRVIEPLSRETFEIARARRQEGAPWPPLGFTEAYLISADLIDEAPAKQAKAKSSQPEKPPRAEKIETVQLTDEKIAVGPYFLQPRPKKGNLPPFYDAVTAEGGLLRAKSFRKVEEGIAFLEELYTSPPDPVTPAPQDAPEVESKDNGGDVQSGPVDGQGQGSPEDR